jgi:hypothetical protein
LRPAQLDHLHDLAHDLHLRPLLGGSITHALDQATQQVFAAVGAIQGVAISVPGHDDLIESWREIIKIRDAPARRDRYRPAQAELAV